MVRVATRRIRDGTAVRDLQLVRNEWDPATSRPEVLHSSAAKTTGPRRGARLVCPCRGCCGPGRRAGHHGADRVSRPAPRAP
jgi:hypothetical protein